MVLGWIGEGHVLPRRELGSFKACNLTQARLPYVTGLSSPYSACCLWASPSWFLRTPPVCPRPVCPGSQYSRPQGPPALVPSLSKGPESPSVPCKVRRGQDKSRKGHSPFLLATSSGCRGGTGISRDDQLQDFEARGVLMSPAL